jgi:hypothetical protein
MISQQELLHELKTLNKREFDKVDGFIMGLISRKEYMQTTPEKRRPLLNAKRQEE